MSPSTLKKPKSRRRRFMNRSFFAGFSEADRKDTPKSPSNGNKPRILESKCPASEFYWPSFCTVSKRVPSVTQRVALKATAHTPDLGPTPRRRSCLSWYQSSTARGSFARVSTTRRAGPTRPAASRKASIFSLICTFAYRGFREARSFELDNRGRVPATPRARVRAHRT